jgi:hypothetical protein
MLRKKLTERLAESSETSSDAKEGAMVWYNNAWVNTGQADPNTGWVKYGFDYVKYVVNK